MLVFDSPNASGKKDKCCFFDNKKNWVSEFLMALKFKLKLKISNNEKKIFLYFGKCGNYTNFIFSLNCGMEKMGLANLFKFIQLFWCWKIE
jgi:hypothetical protein